jgi:glutamine amidotransferase
MTIAIIDYGSGNLRSAAKAFERVAGSTDVKVTSDPKDLDGASHIVLPGVGAFADCMEGLKAVSGMIQALEENILHKRKPFLGICVGMQMLFETGHEHGTHSGLGWISGEVVKIRDEGLGKRGESLKIPHMGWNDLTIAQHGHALLAGIKTGDHAYFVHSYHALCTNSLHVLAITEYGTPITAIVAKDNIMGTQFHPEKSQETGLKLIGNFLRFNSKI